MATWVRDPDRGGVKIPESLKRELRNRLMLHVTKHYARYHAKLVIRFRGPFCYIDAHREGEKFPIHLCRLRHFGPDRWSLAFYTYSHERYDLCVFRSGNFYGTPEEGLDVGAVYLQP